MQRPLRTRGIRLISTASVDGDLKATLQVRRPTTLRARIRRWSSRKRVAEPLELAPPPAPEPIPVVSEEDFQTACTALVRDAEIPTSLVSSAFDPATLPKHPVGPLLPTIVHRAYSPAEVHRANRVMALGFLTGTLISTVIAWVALAW